MQSLAHREHVILSNTNPLVLYQLARTQFRRLQKFKLSNWITLSIQFVLLGKFTLFPLPFPFSLALQLNCAHDSKSSIKQTNWSRQVALIWRPPNCGRRPSGRLGLFSRQLERAPGAQALVLAPTGRITPSDLGPSHVGRRFRFRFRLRACISASKSKRVNLRFVQTNKLVDGKFGARSNPICWPASPG